MTIKYDIFSRKQLQADRCICLAAKRTGKPYEGKPHVRFDEKMLEIGYGCDIVTLSEETERNGEYKYQPVATTPVFYSTYVVSGRKLIDTRKNRAEQAEESSKTFQKLRHRHSAIESDINRLEHHGLDRCLDKGLKGFKRYCALGVVAANPRQKHSGTCFRRRHERNKRSCKRQPKK